jgi:hypothetical protein
MVAEQQLEHVLLRLTRRRILWLSMSPRLAWSFACAVACAAQGAHAADDAAAAALFDRGLADMEAGRFDKGCPALAESYELDPRPGTLFTLAECEAAWGKVASATTHYDDYLGWFDRMTPAEQVRQREREQRARDKKAALAGRVPRLTIQLAPTAPAGTEVRRDGLVLGAASLGVALPVDPGKHVVGAQAPGGRTERIEVVVAEAEDKSVEIGGGLSAPPAPPEERPEEAGMSAWRIGAFSSGAVGIAGVLIGTITGALVLAEKSVIEDHCNEDAFCDAEGLEAADRAQPLGIASTVTFSVGLAGLATGTVLLLTEPATPAPRASGLFVGAGGRW